MQNLTKIFRCPKFNYSNLGSQNGLQNSKSQTLVNQNSQDQLKQLKDKQYHQYLQVIRKQIDISNSERLPIEEANVVSSQINSMIAYLEDNQKLLQQIYPSTILTLQQIRKQLQEIIIKINTFASQSQNIPYLYMIERRNFLTKIRSFIDNHPTNNILTSDKYESMVFIILFTITIKNMFMFFHEFSAPAELHKQNPLFLTRIELLDYKNIFQLQKQHKKLQNMMDYLGSIASDSANNPKNIFGGFKTVWSILKAGLSYRKSQLQTLQMYFIDDYPNIIRHIGLTDQNPFKLIVNKMLPKISSNVIIYIPLNEEQQNNWNIFQQQQNAIPVRVLYYNNLPFMKQSKFKEVQTLKENVMFHIHGGGFVALSSFSVQGYTRVWANQSKMIIFSIDYGLSPKHQFPYAVNQCERVYQFMLRKGCSLLKITPKDIYIGGDSAGGNLACGLTTLILKNKHRRPNGVILIYPFLDARRLYYGSRRLFIGDILLWPSIANIFISGYAPEHYQQIDPLASPILLTEGYFSGDKEDKRFPQNWPPTYFHVGTCDPLRDDSFIFMERMIEANIPCKCVLLTGLKHGYLITGDIAKSAKQAVQNSAKLLVQLMEKTKSEN